MRLSTVVVRYTIKNEAGYLVDLSKTFDFHKDAVEFIKELSRFRLIGKPIMEIGDKK